MNSLSNVMVGKSKWKAPEVGLFKLNIDSSWSDSNGSGGVGGLVRDCQGEVIGGFGKTWVDYSSATQVEMLAILHGLIFAKEIDIHDIILENNGRIYVSSSLYIDGAKVRLTEKTLRVAGTLSRTVHPQLYPTIQSRKIPLSVFP
ncbi:hypothetical protein F0562_003290 [Nyssa sinensis]|uniref:RNase H type-1 domain-containing protein n=1 Tax=Nyssa sinensis TaxID=561372 RepID=A0A5J5C068_9ASTE|nr:hypothetical protein F0562_003290 [Nyssa sinensis]